MAPTSSDGDVHLGEDVVFQILSWLPVISLLRFKSVCKSWKALIESTCFVDQHLAHYHHYLSPSTLILLDPSMGKQLRVAAPCTPSPVFPNFISGDEFQLPPQVSELDVPWLNHLPDAFIDMVTCNGIVCMHVQYDQMLNFLLWNPATKKFRTLLQSLSPPLHPISNLESSVFVGFGFDGKTNDYKVVRITNYIKYPEASRVEVYSLRTDSWRMMDLPFHVERVLSHPKAPYKNGTYCWLGGNLPQCEDKFILSFDFTAEKFGTMSLPDGSGSIQSNAFEYLAIVDGNIACMTSMSKSHFEIWVLYNFGVKESWTKIYMVENLARSLDMELSRIVGLSRNGRFLFFVRDEDNACDLCMYDLVTLHIKNLELQLPEEIKKIEDVLISNYPYGTAIAENKESLVPLESGYGASDHRAHKDPTC